METTTYIPWAADGVAIVQSSLRDEIVWRDGSAEADGLKPTATFGGRSATKDMNQRVAQLDALLHRARCNQAARFGRYDETIEQNESCGEAEK